MESLTTKQAYIAMIFYLEKLFVLTKSDDVAGFLGSMSLLHDGTTADPAVWDDWIESVHKAIKATDDDIRLKLS